MDLFSISALISGLGALLLSAFQQIRSWKHETDRIALEKNTAFARETASASSIGLKYLQEALEAMNRQVIHQQGEMGKLEEKLHQQEARHQRELAELEARYQAEIAELTRRLEESHE